MCDCKPKWICLAARSRAFDGQGMSFQILKIEIRSEGFIPDLYVRFDRDVLEHQLFENTHVLAHVMSVLRGLGYSGPTFDRTELGMQGRSFIVLEPGADFRRFVIERFCWHDLTNGAKAY